jgi:hypothetical protein
MLLHAIRVHLAELGIATGAGVSQVTKMVAALVRGKPLDLPDLARVALETLAQLVFDLQERLRTIDKRLAHWHYTNDSVS